jgi:hypothetical protein
MDLLIGFVIAAFVALMMFRIFQFASGQARIRRRDGS